MTSATHNDVSISDLRAAGNDPAAAKRVDAALRERRKANPQYTLADLCREVVGLADAPKPKHKAAALDVSADDLKAAGNDPAAARRIDAALRERQKTDANYTLADLRREIVGLSPITSAAARVAPASAAPGASASAPQSSPARTGGTAQNEAAARAIMQALVNASRPPDASAEAELRLLAGNDVEANRDLDRFMVWIRNRDTDAFALANAKIYINRIGRAIGASDSLKRAA